MPVRGILLQIGSYKSEAEANESWRAFKARHAIVAGYRSDVTEVNLGARGTWYRLRIGSFADRQSAIGVCERLRADGANCLVAR
jgi:cell division protein FtsN